MADIRSLDIDATDRGIKVQQLYRNTEALTAGSANNKEYFGFYVNTVSGAWSITPIDGKAAISFTPVAGRYYDLHVSSITPAVGDTGFGNLGGRVYELVDPISTWTVDGDGVISSVFTVPSTNGSSELTSASSVLPLVGETYEYTAVVSSYGSATVALITYGGQEIYNKGAAGTFSGTLTASTTAGLVVDIDVETTSDFVLDSISIKRNA